MEIPLVPAALRGARGEKKGGECFGGEPIGGQNEPGREALLAAERSGEAGLRTGQQGRLCAREVAAFAL